MNMFLIVLLLFLLAFACMSLGVIMGRKTMRGSCGARHTGNSGKCHCSSRSVRHPVTAGTTSSQFGNITTHQIVTPRKYT